MLVQNAEDIKYGATVDMVTISCCSCGVPYAIPQILKSHLQDSQNTFYCPNGHPQVYTESTGTRLRRQLEKQKEQEQENIKRLTEEAEIWRGHWQTSVNEKKKISRKLKATEKRIANGTCPCCQRTFTNMQEHMESQHPDFVKSNLHKPLGIKKHSK